MPTNLDFSIRQRPGLEQYGRVSDQLRFALSEGPYGGFAASYPAMLYGKQLRMILGGPYGYPANLVTETKDNNATIAPAASGLAFSGAGAGANDDMAVRSVRALALPQGKLFKAATLLQVDVAAKTGIAFGFASSGAAELFTANPTDGVFMFKPPTATGLVGRVVENGNAVSDSAKLADFADATDVELAVTFSIGTDAGSSWGVWHVNGVATPFSATQASKLFAMFATTPPTMAAHLGFRLGEAVAHTGTVQFGWWEVDR